MSISSVQGVLEGLSTQYLVQKRGATMEAGWVGYSTAYVDGIPGKIAAPSPGLTGEALTSTAGHIVVSDAGVGQYNYLSKVALAGSGVCTVTVYDRLWQNSGLALGSGSQSLGSVVAIPARDSNGATDGVGVLAAIEVSTATGQVVDRTATITYTNSAGTGSRTGTCTIPTTAVKGTFVLFSLQAGDFGVQSIQSVEWSGSLTSGTVHLVLVRPIVQTYLTVANSGITAQMRDTGLPKIWNGSSLMLVVMPSTTTAIDIWGCLHFVTG